MADNQANPTNQVQPQQGNPAAKGVANKLSKVAEKNTVKPDDLKLAGMQLEQQESVENKMGDKLNFPTIYYET